MRPGFDDPALASHPPGGNLYFAADQAVASKLIGPSEGYIPPGQQVDAALGPLMFGSPANTTPSGGAVISAAASSRGHWSEITNFHGSPAPWILIGLLLAAGMLHLSAGASGTGRVKL